MKSRTNPSLCFTVAVAIAFTASAHAADYTWSGGDGNWGDSNWNPGPVAGPTSGSDTATINSGTVTLNAGGMNVSSLTVGAGATFHAYNWISGVNTYTGYNSIVLQGGTVNGVGNYHNWGAGILRNVTVSGSSASTLSASSFFNLNGTGGSSSVFDVGEVTGDANADLTASARLADVSNDQAWNPAALAKSGAGTLRLTAVNDYTGGTTVNGGTLLLDGGNSGNARVRGALTVNSGASVNFANDDGTGLGWNGNAKVTTLTINGGIVSSAGVMHVWNLPGGVNMTGGTLQSNNGVSDAGGPQLEWNLATVTTNASADTATIGGRIRIRGDGGYAGITFNVADGAVATDLLVSAAITEASAGRSITKTGAGTMAFTGANAYTGSTTVNGGTLSIGSPFLDDAAAVSIAAGAVMDLNFTGSDTVGSLSIDGSAPLPADTYNAAHPTYGLFFTGTGSLVIPGANGVWTSLTDGNWGDAANWNAGIAASGYDASATFNAATGAVVTLESNRMIGSLVFDVSDYTLAGANTLTLGSSTGTPTISVGADRITTISANLAGTGGMEKSGSGKLVLTGMKSYTGGTSVAAGTLELAGATGGNAQIHGSLYLGTGTTLLITGGDGTGFGYYNSPVTSITADGATIHAAGGSHLGFGTFMTMSLANGSSLLGSWQWNGNGLLSVSTSGDGTNTIGGTITLRADAGADHTFTVEDGAAETDLLVSASLTDQWPAVWWVSASGLTKAGAGTMVLTGTNTYDGNTLVNDGRLEVAAAGSLRFRPTTNGATNAVSGSASSSLAFLGTVDLDLSAADVTAGNSWDIFNLTSFSGSPPILSPAAVSSGLGAFTQVSPGIWELAVTGAKWVFTTADGDLTYSNLATDYDTWKTANGVTGGEDDDDDSDGLTNREEYAFGLDPTGGESLNPITVPLDKTTGAFSYTRRLKSLTNLDYSVWYSTDLTTWAEDTGATEGTPAVNGEVETVPVILSGSLLTNPKLFIRVRAN